MKDKLIDVFAFIIAGVIVGTVFCIFACFIRFFGNIQINTEVPRYNYTVKLTYADGTSQTLTDYAKYRFGDEEPRIESPILHKGYYVEINNRDYYGIVSCQILNKRQSGEVRHSAYKIDKSPYDIWKNNPDCSLWTALFHTSTEEILKYNK